MKLRKLVVAFALVGTFSAPVGAAVLYSGTFNTGSGYDGILGPVTGFDVYSSGSAAFYCASAAGCAGGTIAFGAQVNPTAGTGVAGDIYRTVYQGVANVVNPGTSSPGLVFPGSTNLGPGAYQISVAAIFNEVLTTTPGVLQPLTGGQVALFYDNNNLGVPASSPSGLPDTFITNTAGILAGVGYTDGLVIATGSVSQFASLPTLEVCAGGSCSGSANIAGPVVSALLSTTLNGIGFNLAPTGYNSTTTLQFGSVGSTDAQTVGFFDNANGFTRVTGVNPAWVQLADANVHFTVPEPTSVALLGVALAALGFARRRRVA